MANQEARNIIGIQERPKYDPRRIYDLLKLQFLSKEKIQEVVEGVARQIKTPRIGEESLQVDEGMLSAIVKKADSKSITLNERGKAGDGIFTLTIIPKDTFHGVKEVKFEYIEHRLAQKTITIKKAEGDATTTQKITYDDQTLKTKEISEYTTVGDNTISGDRYKLVTLNSGDYAISRDSEIYVQNTDAGSDIRPVPGLSLSLIVPLNMFGDGLIQMNVNDFYGDRVKFGQAIEKYTQANPLLLTRDDIAIAK